MEVSSKDDSEYRVLIGGRIKYIIVAPGTFDRSTLSMPLSSLPPVPYHDDWTIAYVSRDSASHKLKASLSQRQLNGVRQVWHPQWVDCLKLKRLKQLTGAAFECTWAPGTPQSQHSTGTMIAKIARFEWEIPRMERETQAYRHLEGSELAPRFLGHIHEQGRVMGCCWKRSRGVRLGPTTLQAVVRSSNGFTISAWFTMDGDESLMRVEMASLGDQLMEDTGRGGGFMFSGVHDDD
ncbi:MAG: hypothetical protein M1818_007451 [Claussenomyces sp. TS43310]|nr:MAG: hypothetical protein M1818_007451 [Claussenomyces sp. TS43310]